MFGRYTFRTDVNKDLFSVFNSECARRTVIPTPSSFMDLIIYYMMDIYALDVIKILGDAIFLITQY